MKNSAVDIMLNKSPEKVQPLLKAMLKTLKKNKVRLLIEDAPQVQLSDDVRCSGFFNSSPLEFAVAVGKDFDVWFKIFIHEYCHFEQWSEDAKLFDQKADNIAHFFSHLEPDVKISKKNLNIYMKDAIWLEYDCERRVLEKIKEYGLEEFLNPEVYAQTSNSYFNFYHFVKEKREWYKSGQEPYNLEHVWSLFPKELVIMKSLPDNIMAAYEDCIATPKKTKKAKP